MKIFVKDGNQGRQITVRVKDLSSELEKISVRILKIGTLVEKKFHSDNKQEDIKRKRPVWRKIFSRLMESTASAQSHTDASGKPKTVEINISIPYINFSDSYKKIRKGLKNFDFKDKRLYVGLSVILLLIIGHGVLSGSNSSKPVPQTKEKRAALVAKNNKVKLSKGAPKFSTLLPAGKSIADLGGWTRVSPPNRDPVYAYVDKVGSVRLAVSEQPLPKSLRSDTKSHLAQLAQNLNAYDKISSGKTLAYIGTSQKGQSIILSKNNLLVLIRSSAFLTNSQWVSYINSLQ